MPDLRLDGLSVTFGGVTALDGVSFSVQAGRIHGLIGPNGAGKTTLLNAISGLVQPTVGTVTFGGHRIDGAAAHRIAQLGITRTFQHIRVFPDLSVQDNVRVGQHLVTRAPFWQRLVGHQAERRESAAAAAEANALLDRVGLAALADRLAGTLAYGDQRRLEIARALAARPSLLLLDEPAAGLNGAEVDHLATTIRGLADGQRSILLVEHNMRLVMRLCQQITVLDFGRLIADGPPATVARDPVVIAAYLGADEADPPAPQDENHA